MKIQRLVLGAVLAVPVCAVLPAQQNPTGFHTVNCVKINPEKSAEFHKFMSDVITKVALSRVDSGDVVAWYLLRAVMPLGKSAECDYVTVSVYPGAPPEPFTGDKMTAVLKKAGVSMSGAEYVARRDSVSTLISSNLFQNEVLVGKANKGGYLAVNYMKTSNIEAWVKFEKELWQPVVEAMVKDGVAAGWSLNLLAFGLESDLPYQGVTVDVYSSWDQVFKDDPQFVDRFKKVHPDLDQNTWDDRLAKTRTMVRSELYAVEDLITSGKQPVSTVGPQHTSQAQASSSQR